MLEQRIAALEGGVGAPVFAGSGRFTTPSLTSPAPGTTSDSTAAVWRHLHAFAHMFPALGIDVRFAADDSVAALEALIDDNTKAVFFETIVIRRQHRGYRCSDGDGSSHGVCTIADNTVASPSLLKPIEHGVDIVVHSVTKYMGGHGTTLGGIIVDSGKFP